MGGAVKHTAVAINIRCGSVVERVITP